jgi:hypothetical protein
LPVAIGRKFLTVESVNRHIWLPGTLAFVVPTILCTLAITGDPAPVLGVWRSFPNADISRGQPVVPGRTHPAGEPFRMGH